MTPGKNVFATSAGIIVTGAVIGVLAPLLQKFGNPGNMGVCMACFERDVAGALGLHRAEVIQYLRPEFIGFIFGAFAAALLFREFKPRGGSSPVTRFVLGMCAMVGALVFLGCPWRALLRLAGGDWNAVFGLAGLVSGVAIGTGFFRAGYNLGRNGKHAYGSGLMMPLVAAGLLILLFLFPQVPSRPKSGVLFYSVKGPGAQHAAIFISLGVALVVGFIAQRSRFCTMGGLRDLILFRHAHLFSGLVALTAAAFITNLALGRFKPGFAGQPIAHTMSVWNFAGMLVAGLAFALAGGCPGRQLFLTGEGDGGVTPMDVLPLKDVLLAPVSLYFAKDFGDYLMVRAANMKITVAKADLTIVNVSGGGCPDVPYLADRLVGRRMGEGPEPRELGRTLCGYALQLAYEELRRRCAG